MSYLKSAIFANSECLKTEKITFIDIGARGDIPPPWKQLEKKYPKRLDVIGFEPDDKECEALSKKFPNRQYINKALGADINNAKFYLNKTESTSSNYRSNQKLLKKFHLSHSSGRKVIKTLDIPVTTLDEVFSKRLISPFVKIDVQGAELSIMKGGKNFFKNMAVGFTAECWTYQVYEGQPLLQDILTWACSNDFDLYGMQEVGRWDLNSGIRFKSKGIPVCFDVLFFKNFQSYNTNLRTLEEIKTYALLLDLWGFPDAAICLLTESCKDEHSLEELKNLISKSRNRRSFKNHILNEFIDKIKIKLGASPNFPPLHD